MKSIYARFDLIIVEKFPPNQGVATKSHRDKDKLDCAFSKLQRDPAAAGQQPANVVQVPA